MIPLRDHIAIRLTDFRGDGTKHAASAFEAIMRKQSAAGMLASGNTIFLIEQAIEETYRATLEQGATFVAEAVGQWSADYVDLLDPFARTFQTDLLRAYEGIYGRLGLRGAEPSFQSRSVVILKSLETRRDRGIGDFKIGMVGGKRVSITKTQNSVSFDGATINAPVSVSQSINQAGLDTEALQLLGRILQSDELAYLPAEARDAVEAAQDELGKPTPNRAKVTRWLTAIAGYAGQLGKDALSAAVKELAKSYAQQHGIPNPFE